MILSDARADLFKQAEKGAICPCCDQYVKIYKRKLNSSMACGLVYVYNYFRSPEALPWLHLPGFFTEKKICSSNDGGLLRHWELIEPMVSERKDGSWRNGHYKITSKGVAFVKGEISVPKYVYIYSQNVLGFSDGDKYPKEDTTIQDSLGENFNYRELMGDE